MDGNVKDKNNEILLELNELKQFVKVISDNQKQLMSELNILRQQQKKLLEEVKINNIVLHSIAPGNEIIN